MAGRCDENEPFHFVAEVGRIFKRLFSGSDPLLEQILFFAIWQKPDPRVTC